MELVFQIATVKTTASQKSYKSTRDLPVVQIQPLLSSVQFMPHALYFCLYAPQLATLIFF